MNNRYYQKGIVIPTLVISLLALFAIAGLAMDMSNQYLTKTLIQNALDASALSGAKVLNDTGDTDLAEQAALRVFNFNLTGKLEGEAITPTFEFSDTLVPFVDGGVDPLFIRASVTDYNMAYFFAQVIPGLGTTQLVTGSAVSGPSPPLGDDNGDEICGIAPLLICADVDPDTGAVDDDCSDNECYGYPIAQENIVMKTGSGTDWDVGVGNFQLISLDCGTGGACVRSELSGEFESCLTIGESVTTEPGNTVGPTEDGYNSRFGEYQGGGMNEVDHPPDTVTAYDTSFDQANPDVNNYWYSDYKMDQALGNHDWESADVGGYGVAGRRILTVPVGNCTGTTNGRGDVQVLGTACMFMTHPSTHAGNTQNVYGEFIGQCEGNGDMDEFPEGPGVGFGVYKIILYKDPDSLAS